MEPVSIQPWAVVVSGVAYFIMGALWYSPVLFGRPWMQAMGKKPEELSGGSPAVFLVTFLAELFAVYVLAHFVRYAGAATVSEGLLTGLWAGVGLVGMATLVNHLYDAGRPRVLFLINAGYHVVSLALAGILLAVWR
jgi:hypothetical protein